VYHLGFAVEEEEEEEDVLAWSVIVRLKDYALALDVVRHKTDCNWNRLASHPASFDSKTTHWHSTLSDSKRPCIRSVKGGSATRLSATLALGVVRLRLSATGTRRRPTQDEKLKKDGGGELDWRKSVVRTFGGRGATLAFGVVRLKAINISKPDS
jgi:hypothetical protein